MWGDPATHECGPVCMVRRPRGDVFCQVLGQVIFDAPTERPAAASRARSTRDMVCKNAAFSSAVRSVLARLLSSVNRMNTESARASKARAGAMRLFKSRVAAAKAPVVLSDVMHAVWEHMERAGGDAPVAVRMCESTHAELARVCVDYYSTYVSRAPATGKACSRPSSEYIALALLYNLPGAPNRLHAGVRPYLPDLRTLKNYGFNVHKFTNAQRFVSRAAAHTLTRPASAA